jgi:MFS family permease
MDRAQKRLVPFLLLMFVLAFLDRANIGFAKNAFQVSTGVSDAAFALGAGIFFLGYAVFEIPSNIILHHVGARRWMARIMVSWGLVAAGFALVQNETQFLVLRVLLGIAEAGFFPGVVYYLSFWFTPNRRSTAMGLLYLGVPVSFIFGSPLSGLLLDMDGALGIHGWQWMFAVEGMLAAIVGVWTWFYLTDKPSDAGWIPADEREALQKELDAEAALTTPIRGNPLKALVDSRILFLCLIYFLIQVAVYGVTFYLPTQVAALLGKKVGLEVGLVAAIPWVCAAVGNMTIPRYSDVSGHRGTLAALVSGLAGLGIIVSSVNSPVIAIAALSAAAVGLFAASPIFWTMPARLMGGVQLASAIALINSIGNLGGFVAPQARVWAEQTTHNPSAGLYLLGGVGLATAALFIVAAIHGMGGRSAPQKQKKSDGIASAKAA